MSAGEDSADKSMRRTVKNVVHAKRLKREEAAGDDVSPFEEEITSGDEDTDTVAQEDDKDLLSSEQKAGPPSTSDDEASIAVNKATAAVALSTKRKKAEQDAAAKTAAAAEKPALTAAAEKPALTAAAAKEEKKAAKGETAAAAEAIRKKAEEEAAKKREAEEEAKRKEDEEKKAAAAAMPDEEKRRKDKYKKLLSVHDCELRSNTPWSETESNHIELDSDEIHKGLDKILEQFLNDMPDLKLIPEEEASKLKKNKEFIDATTGNEKYFFAYGSEWETYYKNSQKCKTRTIDRSKTNIETVGIKMKLSSVFMLFPDKDHLIIACRADNNFGLNRAVNDPTQSTSSTTNTMKQSNASYSSDNTQSDEINYDSDGGADINFGSLSNENYMQEGGSAINFGLTSDYTIKEFESTLKPIGREVNNKLRKDVDGYNYQASGLDDIGRKNLKKMVQTMIKHMGTSLGPLSGVSNFLNYSQSGSEKMAAMDLHIYKIKPNTELANKIFASENYFTNIVNINFPGDTNRVLTFGSISAPTQFMQISESEGFRATTIGNKTNYVEMEERIEALPSNLKRGGNSNKKQLRNQLNTMSMRELRKLHKEEEISTNSNRTIKGLVNNYMRYHNDSNN